MIRPGFLDSESRQDLTEPARDGPAAHRLAPTYCPHLDPIERLWGLMHKTITQKRCYETVADFSHAILTFLREEVPRNLATAEEMTSD